MAESHDCSQELQAMHSPKEINNTHFVDYQIPAVFNNNLDEYADADERTREVENSLTAMVKRASSQLALTNSSHSHGIHVKGPQDNFDAILISSARNRYQASHHKMMSQEKCYYENSYKNGKDQVTDDRISQTKYMNNSCYNSNNNERLIGKCARHPNLKSRFYCDSHREAICTACAIKLIGDHSNCKAIKLKIMVPESEQQRLENVIILQALVYEHYKYLMQLSVKEPLSFDVAKKIHLFNEQPTSEDTALISPVLHDFSKTINNLIVKFAAWEDDHSFFRSLVDGLCIVFMEISDMPLNELHNFNIVIPPKANVSNNLYITGQGVNETVRLQTGTFYISNKDIYSYLETSLLEVNAFCVEGNTSVTTMISRHYMPGVSEVAFRVVMPGLHEFNVKMNGVHVLGSPYQVVVQSKSKFYPNMEVVEFVGDQFNFNRPWGVCTDAEGNIYLSDRCNDNIKVLNHELQFKFLFGGSGNEIGLLKKPSGIAIDKNGDVVVCDKDNNRIQVFSSKGKPLRMSHSSNNLEYPWSIAVNSKNDYIVTHSKSKLSIMSSDFRACKIINTSGHYFKPSPRGVCIGYLDEVFFTDFETGTIYIADVRKDECYPKFQTCPRRRHYDEAPLKRIQNITIDNDGYLLVTDSKNCCVEAYTYGGVFVTKWSVPGKPMTIVPIPNTASKYLITMESSEASVCVVDVQK